MKMRMACGVLATVAGMVGVVAAGQQAFGQQSGPSLAVPARLVEASANGGRVKTWVFLRDKGVQGEALERAIAELGETYPERAMKRRRVRGSGGVDARDLPLSAAYVASVRSTGAEVVQESRWVNAVSVRADAAQLRALAALPCVDRLEPVRTGKGVRPVEVVESDSAYSNGGYRGRDVYGRSSVQLNQINLVALHQAGFTGAGVVVGVLDTGFRRDHDAFNQPGLAVSVIAERDFINNDGNTGIESGDASGQHGHGTLILGCMGANYPNELVGGAFDADYVLCKTEDISSETPIEEDNYVAGIEFAEFHGADLTTSSLGYIDWYTQGDLDGVTAVTTIVVNTAAEHGVHCCTAAGNEGHDEDPQTSHLIAPADGLKVLTCGAADSTGAIAGFSSDGPTADGRVKPELLARGVSTRTVSTSTTDGFASANGTSLSTPLLACAVACLVQQHPEWTVDQMRSALFTTALDAAANGGAFDPLYVRGYGMVDAFGAGAVSFCTTDYNQDGGGDTSDVLDLANDIASGTQTFPGSNTDFNQDGGADTTDVIDMADVIAGGACPG